MPYTVTASDRGAVVTATRIQPTSACVLARKWADAGLTDVRIQWDAHSYDLATFLATFEVKVGHLKPRRHDIRTW